MAALFDLPNELLNLILLSLLYHDRDLETLTSLSLASRQLRSIVEPVTNQYLCLQGHFGSRHPSESPDAREAAFLDFFSDDARAAAVRYLKLTGHVEITGIELLTRLQNVAYLEISGAWADQQDQPDCFHMVYTLVGRFPTLRTVYLKNCYQEDEDFDEFRDDLKDDPYENMVPNAHVPSGIISTSLRHIICENVDPAFRKLWLSTPEIEVVEMHMCEFKPWEKTSRNTGAYRMLLRDPVFCGKVKCFRIENRLVDEDDEYEQEWRLYSTRDAVNIHSFLQWRAQVLPCLQELILELPFHPKHIPDILAALPELCPSLKVFKFELSPQGYKDFIYSGQKFPLPSSKEFQFLEEVRLPFTGLNYDLVTALPCFFLNAPRLAHIYLSNPRILDGQEPAQQALLACAEGYASAVHTLRSVSWDCLATIEIGTAANNPYEVRAFRKPWWEERGGFVGWWQQSLDTFFIGFKE